MNVRIWTILCMLMLQACAGSSEPHSVVDYVWQLPPGMPEPVVPANNPMSTAKVELGRFLFYDKRLSINNTQSCASCHQQSKAFTEGLGQAVGATAQVHPRSTMSLANVAYANRLAWANLQLKTLEEQALVPMINEMPIELGLANAFEEVLSMFRADPRYQMLFARAFPRAPAPIELDSVLKALASFERTIISGDSPYDRYTNQGQPDAMSEAALRGRDLFFSERLECFHCHGGFNLSDSVSHVGSKLTEINFHNNGLYNIDGKGAYPPDNTGLYAMTGRARDMGRFKAPTLRNIAITAPYMHDGSIATLEGVLDHYAAGGRTLRAGPFAGDGSKNPYKSELVRGFTLTDDEKMDVVAFLRSLTDERFLNDARLGDPF